MVDTAYAIVIRLWKGFGWIDPSDPFLADFTPSLTAAQTSLSAASSASDIQAAVTNLGTALASFATTIADQATHGFTISLLPDRNIVQPGAPEVYNIVIDNTGSLADLHEAAQKAWQEIGRRADGPQPA